MNSNNMPETYLGDFSKDSTHMGAKFLYWFIRLSHTAFFIFLNL